MPQKLLPHQRRLAKGLDVKIRRLPRDKARLHLVDAEVFAAAGRLFRTDSAIAFWLAQPAPALHGKSPLQVLRSSKGRQDVLDLIGGIAHGAAAQRKN